MHYRRDFDAVLELLAGDDLRELRKATQSSPTRICDRNTAGSSSWLLALRGFATTAPIPIRTSKWGWYAPSYGLMWHCNSARGLVE
jgi:hypothetical protein